MKLFIRTTKFPYLFWSFNRAFECEIDLKKESYKNLNMDTQYKIKPFNYYMFLLLKYLPLGFLLYFCFSIYDFNFNKLMITSYIFSILLLITINVFDNLTRTLLSVIILAVAGCIGIFTMNEPFIIAYVIKYFIFLSMIIFFILDLKIRPYSLLNENHRVVSHIMIPKHLVSKELDSNLEFNKVKSYEK